MLFINKNQVGDNESENLNSFSIIIAARNEEKVIGHLIDSIYNQDYPQDLIKIYVIADNCTDKTPLVAAKKGATVFKRSDLKNIGKGFALNKLFNAVIEQDNNSDAFIIFDADNLLTRNYIKEMNRTYNKGYKIITSYRNSKNYGFNWISAGSGLWFLRESKYLNNARHRLKTSCAVSGTGFLVKRDLIEKYEGWNFFLLTEDLEFTIDNIINAEKIGYCSKAIFYDEQPITFKQSWNQRLRWAKGFYQVLSKYGLSLIKGIFNQKNFACFDMFMYVFPASLLSSLIFLFYITKLIILFFLKDTSMLLNDLVVPILLNFLYLYLFLYTIGIITTITEWKKIIFSSGSGLYSSTLFTPLSGCSTGPG